MDRRHQAEGHTEKQPKTPLTGTELQHSSTDNDEKLIPGTFEVSSTDMTDRCHQDKRPTRKEFMTPGYLSPSTVAEMFHSSVDYFEELVPATSSTFEGGSLDRMDQSRQKRNPTEEGLMASSDSLTKIENQLHNDDTVPCDELARLIQYTAKSVDTGLTNHIPWSENPEPKRRVTIWDFPSTTISALLDDLEIPFLNESTHGPGDHDTSPFEEPLSSSVAQSSNGVKSLNGKPDQQSATFDENALNIALNGLLDSNDESSVFRSTELATQNTTSIEPEDISNISACSSTLSGGDADCSIEMDKPNFVNMATILNHLDPLSYDPTMTSTIYDTGMEDYTKNLLDMD